MAKNQYDDMKNMLNKLRVISEQTVDKKRGQMLEQLEVAQQGAPQQEEIPQQTQQTGENESEDVFVINNVDIEIKSTDSSDITLSEEEKGKISQLIDNIRTNVSETIELEKMDIYENNVKLSGTIPNVGVGFILSAGDEQGFYLTSSSMIKVDEQLLDIITKMNSFMNNYNALVSELIINRKEN
jgi:hypothetical protein